MLQSVSKYWTSSTHPPRVFKRQSMFAHSVNFEHHDSLLTFHDHTRIPSPMSILLTLEEGQLETYFKDVNEVILTSSGIAFSNVCFPFSLTEHTHHHLDIKTPLSAHHLDALQATLQSVLALKPPSTTLEARWFDQRLLHLQASVLEEASLKEALQHLLGFGSGLTPSGDDAIVGFLAGLHYIQQQSTLKIVKQHLSVLLEDKNATVWLSQHFLHMALEGWFIEPILTLYEKLLGENDIETIIHQILSLGHTSGADLLRGLALAISTGGTSYAT